MFFVLALGRSGTNFLADLLSRDPSGIVHHEPGPHDHKLAGLRHAGRFDRVLDQMLARRFEPLLAEVADRAFYGEVNSYLRYEVDWLRERFNPTLIHLVRDGRDFVRSAYTRDVFTAGEREVPVLPLDNDPAAACWSRMDRFDRLCWYWDHTNRFLADRLPNPVRFERLLTDYEYFGERILQPTGVRLTREQWAAEIGRPKNTTRANRMRRRLRDLARGRRRVVPEPLPHWTGWSKETSERFWSRCGETMAAMGYERT